MCQIECAAPKVCQASCSRGGAHCCSPLAVRWAFWWTTMRGETRPHATCGCQTASPPIVGREHAWSARSLLRDTNIISLPQESGPVRLLDSSADSEGGGGSRVLADTHIEDHHQGELQVQQHGQSTPDPTGTAVHVPSVEPPGHCEEDNGDAAWSLHKTKQRFLCTGPRR